MVVSMVICDVFAEFLLESVCAPTSTLSTLEVATKVEHLMMGKFISAALFELEVITLTISHSILQRSNGIRAIGKLTSTLLKGSLLYALSLLGMSLVHDSFSVSVDCASSNFFCKHSFFCFADLIARAGWDCRCIPRCPAWCFSFADSF
jgi:hypothetical protein